MVSSRLRSEIHVTQRSVRPLSSSAVWVSGRTLIKLIMDHGFNPPEDPDKPKEADDVAATDESEGAPKGKAD